MSVSLPSALNSALTLSKAFPAAPTDGRRARANSRDAPAITPRKTSG